MAMGKGTTGDSGTVLDMEPETLGAPDAVIMGRYCTDHSVSLNGSSDERLWEDGVVCNRSEMVFTTRSVGTGVGKGEASVASGSGVAVGGFS